MSLEIKLTRGRVAQIDEADFDAVSRHSWSVSKGYATTSVARRTVSMARLIMAAATGSVVDHINGDKLDNRRKNLRLCSQRENTRNRRLSRANTSGFTGVSFKKSKNKWSAQIQVDGRFISLGLHDDALKAARAYDAAAIRHFGDFARPNFPACRDWLMLSA